MNGMYANTSLTMAQAAYINAMRQEAFDRSLRVNNQVFRALDAMTGTEMEGAWELFEALRGPGR